MDPTRTPARRGVLRVVWLPGTDRLRGTCHCGAEHVTEGPAEMWEWLLAHPVGHDPAGARTPDVLVPLVVSTAVAT